MASVKQSSIPYEKYNFSRISRKHRKEQQATMDIFKLPRVGPKTGDLSSKLFNKVHECIDEYATFKTNSKSKYNGKTFLMNHGKKAMIQSRSTGAKTHKPEKRSCRKITSQKLTNVLSPLLTQEFHDAFGDEVLETRIHPEHCVLLL